MGEMDDVAEGKGSRTEDDQMKNFVNSGRSGRRNAVPEVDTLGIDPDATKLAERLSSMNTVGRDDCTVSNTTGKKDTAR
uniref:P protein n=1 Tax=Loa loa TaxID=7209 RepID=A0A1I7VJW4_LOALO